MNRLFVPISDPGNAGSPPEMKSHFETMALNEWLTDSLGRADKTICSGAYAFVKFISWPGGCAAARQGVVRKSRRSRGMARCPSNALL